ncbi:MAG: hypothetical protein V4604_00350 [Bacteroidota bacterium]
MKTLLLVLATFLSATTFAVELNYKWKANTSYRFTAIEKDDITISAMGMNTVEKFTTTVEFVVFIQSVDSMGMAKGRLYLTNYSVKDSKGVALATLAALPKDAVQSAITVDKKGHFTFDKRVTLITTATGNFLVYAKADENSAASGFDNGSEKVDVYAEFDPKTGKLKAGYSVKTMNKTKPVTITENENSDELDVFPYDFLEMMIMPDGAVNQGDHYEVKAGVYNCAVNATSVVNGVATLTETISTDKSQDPYSGAASGESQEGSFSMEEFGGMEDMDLDAEDQEAVDMTTAMSPNMSGTITAVFDASNGMFTGLKGTLNTVIDMMGMKMTVKSVLEMKKKA